MEDTWKDGLLLGTSQLLHTSCTEVNKFLLPYVILFQRVNFWQYFVCLREKEYLNAAT